MFYFNTCCKVRFIFLLILEGFGALWESRCEGASGMIKGPYLWGIGAVRVVACRDHFFYN
jgi:hypothetical protein